MEKWTVTAVNGNLKAKSGNNHPLFIIVSIEDANGAPVQSLTVDNFLLAAEVAGGLAFSETLTLSPARLPSVYVFSVVPYPPGHTWVGGLFVFSIAVHSQAARGQTLCSCVLD